MKRYKASLKTGNDGIFKVDLVDKPAIEQAAFYFNEQMPIKLALDEERGIIIGAALIPDKAIFRRQKLNGVEEEFEIFFPADMMEEVLTKFMKLIDKSNVGIMHTSDKPVNDVCINMCFMADEQLGVQHPKGFEDNPDKTIYMAGKVDNPDIKAKIKAGEITGWSIEGLFTFEEDSTTELSLSEQIAKALNVK